MKIIKVKNCMDCPWFKESPKDNNTTTLYCNHFAIPRYITYEPILGVTYEKHRENIKFPSWCPLENFQTGGEISAKHKGHKTDSP